MPSASPPTPPTAPGAAATLVGPPLSPIQGPSYPKAGPLGMLAVALAYFSLGVAVGALLKHSPRWRRALPFIVVPGVLAGLGFLLWVLKTLR